MPPEHSENDGCDGVCQSYGSCQENCKPFYVSEVFGNILAASGAIVFIILHSRLNFWTCYHKFGYFSLLKSSANHYCLSAYPTEG